MPVRLEHFKTVLRLREARRVTTPQNPRDDQDFKMMIFMFFLFPVFSIFLIFRFFDFYRPIFRFFILPHPLPPPFPLPPTPSLCSPRFLTLISTKNRRIQKILPKIGAPFLLF